MTRNPTPLQLAEQLGTTRTLEAHRVDVRAILSTEAMFVQADFDSYAITDHTIAFQLDGALDPVYGWGLVHDILHHLAGHGGVAKGLPAELLALGVWGWMVQAHSRERTRWVETLDGSFHAFLDGFTADDLRAVPEANTVEIEPFAFLAIDDVDLTGIWAEMDIGVPQVLAQIESQLKAWVAQGWGLAEEHYHQKLGLTPEAMMDAFRDFNNSLHGLHRRLEQALRDGTLDHEDVLGSRLTLAYSLHGDWELSVDNDKLKSLVTTR